MSEQSTTNYHDFYLKRGTFYRTSDKAGKGYKKVEYKDQKGEDQVTYHKLVAEVSGELVGMHITDGKFGEQIKIFLEEEKDEVNVISIPVYNQFGDINGFADSFARHVGNLAKKNWYTFTPNTERLDKNDRPYMGLVIKDSNDEEIRWTISNDDVPKVEVTKNALGKNLYNGQKRTDYLLGLLLKSVKVKNGNNSSSNSKPEKKEAKATKAEPAKAEATVDANVGDDPGDDLPF